MVLIKEFSQLNIPIRTIPIHAKIDSILDFGVPGGIWDKILVINNIGNCIGDLESSESGNFVFSVSDS
jgi:hypothetical protein